MAQRLEMLRGVCEAIRLDSNGEKQVAFMKYLTSIQALCDYINNQCIVIDANEAIGHSKIVGDVEESKQIISVIKECAERMNFILCCPETPESDLSSFPPNYDDLFGSSASMDDSGVSSLGSSSHESQKSSINSNIRINTPVTQRSILSENMEKSNAQLFKIFQTRMENAKDERTKISLKLELHRRLAENRMMTMSKQAQIVRQQQKESRLALEKADRALSGESRLSEREKEKRNFFDLVLQYDAAQVSPAQLKFASDSVDFESARRMFESTLQIKDHPITKWLIHIQTKMKCEVENALREYSHLTNFLPNKISDKVNELYPLTLLQTSKRGVEPIDIEDESVLASLSCLSQCLEKISSSIKMAIDDILEVFCLAYKGLLPFDAKTACYKHMETVMLQPLWPSLILLFRMKNFQSERKVAETMVRHLNSSPEDFEVPIDTPANFDDTYSQIIHQLRLLLTLPSLLDKISTLVYVSQKLCGDSISENGRLLGADDLICMLSYVIVQAKIPQLVSECWALEQLLDQKYLLGEEGYSLTSFQTALKYLEMKKVIDAECASGEHR